MIVSDYLSLWEVAHRWHGIDPNKTDSESLPLDVQDSLRFLCRLVLEGRVGLYDEVATYPTSEDDQSPPRIIAIDAKKLPVQIEEALFNRKYDKSVLDGYKISRGGLFRWGFFEYQGFPDFWYDDSLLEIVGGGSDGPAEEKVKQSSQRPSYIDKTICQAIARTLWDIYPNMTIADMTKHPAIQKYGNGALYKGQNTLRNWLSELAPSNKPGRPPKAKPSIDAA